MSDREPSRFSFLDIDDETPAPAAKPAKTIGFQAPAASAPAPDAAATEAARQAREDASIAAIIARRATVRQAQPVVAPAPTTTVKNERILVDMPAEQVGAQLIREISGTVTLAALTEAWLAEGLDASWLPKAPRAETALTEACKEYQSKSIKIESVDGQDGWFFVDVNRSRELQFRVGSRFFLDEQGIVQCEGESHAHLLLAIRAAHAQRMTEVNLQTWLGKIVDKLDGVSLRRAGAIYFIPRQNVLLLKRVKAVVCKVTACQLSVYAMLQSADMISDLLVGIGGEVATLEKQVQQDTIKEVGARAARSRLDDCNVLTAKIESYEKLLGAKFEAPRAAITKLIEKLNEYSTRFAQLEI